MLRLKPPNGAIALATMALALLSGCGKSLARSECETLLLHYTELLARSDRPDATALERLKFKEQAREKAAKDPEMGRCGKSVSRSQYDCAVSASSTDEFERCLM